MAQPGIIANGGVDADVVSSPASPEFDDLRDPFYASIFPQCYALAATTVISYTLLIMLFIAPRSFLDGGVVVLGRRGFTNGPSNGISIGGRPWLQKVATLTVAVSLTIATCDTFRVAETQYSLGIENAKELQASVLGGTELQVIQLISDTFLWLAQAQTLIRLFPRQREKVIIKWTAFSLISLDVIFGALESFQYTGRGNTRPQNFNDAVPALSYLFQLSLGLLYAAWVLYYALMKKRYAFYHPLMKNICLVAVLSVISLLVPVVFFVLDIAEPELVGWSDYVRWVGAAAASVVVWEWVERIEALEREERKDGVLGREVFDGDEMIDMSPSDLSWPRRRSKKKTELDEEEGGDSANSANSANSSSYGGHRNMWPAMSSIANRYRPRASSSPNGRQPRGNTAAPATGRTRAQLLQPPLWPSRPQPAVTPVSRTDTASADSTVYAIRYQTVTESISRVTDDRDARPPSRSDAGPSPTPDPSPDGNAQPRDESQTVSPPAEQIAEKEEVGTEARRGGRLNSLSQLNPLRRASRDSPREAPSRTTPKAEKTRRGHEALGWSGVRSRVEDFTSTQAERILERIRPTPDTESLPVAIIPAPPRRGAALAQLLEEEQSRAGGEATVTTPTSPLARHITEPSMAANAAAPPVSPRRTSSNSDTANDSRPARRQSEGRDRLQLRPPNRRDSTPNALLPSRDGDQRGRGSERRAVDDILGDETHPSSP